MAPLMQDMPPAARPASPHPAQLRPAELGRRPPTRPARSAESVDRPAVTRAPPRPAIVAEMMTAIRALPAAELARVPETYTAGACACAGGAVDPDDAGHCAFCRCRVPRPDHGRSARPGGPRTHLADEWKL